MLKMMVGIQHRSQSLAVVFIALLFLCPEDSVRSPTLLYCSSVGERTESSGQAGGSVDFGGRSSESSSSFGSRGRAEAGASGVGGARTDTGSGGGEEKNNKQTIKDGTPGWWKRFWFLFIVVLIVGNCSVAAGCVVLVRRRGRIQSEGRLEGGRLLEARQGTDEAARAQPPGETRSGPAGETRSTLRATSRITTGLDDWSRPRGEAAKQDPVSDYRRKSSPARSATNTAPTAPGGGGRASLGPKSKRSRSSGPATGGTSSTSAAAPDTIGASGAAADVANRLAVPQGEENDSLATRVSQICCDIRAELEQSTKNGETLESRRKLIKFLSVKWHPDKNPDDEEVAKRVFQFVQDEKPGFLGQT